MSNFNNYGENPLLFTHYDDLQELYKYASFPIILDVAHLKVSCNTLKIPVLGGNVSMYNSTDNKDIIPSIVIVMIGLMN